MENENLINVLFKKFPEIRYVALYLDGKLISQQKENAKESSSSETDTYEELLVNPVLLKLGHQRGNIDCGGLNFIIVAYGKFYQIVKSTTQGHISICIELTSNLNELPKLIFEFISENYPHISLLK